MYAQPTDVISFEDIGGFESPLLTNEDMLMAARALRQDTR